LRCDRQVKAEKIGQTEKYERAGRERREIEERIQQIREETPR
jgi:hypothetical protein